jgi:hypothetical protein
MDHPPFIKLDALAAGEAAPQIESHVRACEACTKYVTELRAQADAFRAQAAPRAFAEKVQARADRAKARTQAKVVWLFGPVLAAAAALLLFLRVPMEHPSKATDDTPAATAPAGTESVHFKGGISVAVIRERDGHQERVTGPIDVRAADAIRVEIASDRAVPVAAGLLSDDGTWTLLLGPTELEAGTHYSDLAARFDDSPTRAVLLVGSPDLVERARRTHDFGDLVAWPVRSSNAP